jgi:hypothetical protein
VSCIQFSKALHFHASSQNEQVLLSCRMPLFLLILAKLPFLISTWISSWHSQFILLNLSVKYILHTILSLCFISGDICDRTFNHLNVSQVPGYRHFPLHFRQWSMFGSLFVSITEEMAQLKLDTFAMVQNRNSTY